MKNKTFNYIATWGLAYYNRLREFYDNPDRLELLNYVLYYGIAEAKYLGQEENEKVLKEKICLKSYKTLKKLYSVCIKQLWNNEPIPEITIPTVQEIHDDIKKKYKNLEKKIQEENDSDKSST